VHPMCVKRTPLPGRKPVGRIEKAEKSTQWAHGKDRHPEMETLGALTTLAFVAGITPGAIVVAPRGASV
jgi:hypothetical protein